jgi:hypothetical protein
MELTAKGADLIVASPVQRADSAGSVGLEQRSRLEPGEGNSEESWAWGVRNFSGHSLRSKVGRS